MKSQLSRALAPNPMPAIHSGVTVSCIPRSSPVAAKTISIAGRPHIEMPRYVTACSETAGVAPKRPTRNGVARYPTRASTAPIARASHIPSIPTETAFEKLPAPNRRATAGVVEYARKTIRPTIVCSTADAMPRPASGVTPRCPTSAESTMRNSGSAMRAPSAGTARRRMSRFSAGPVPVTLRAYEPHLGCEGRIGPGEHILDE